MRPNGIFQAPKSASCALVLASGPYHLQRSSEPPRSIVGGRDERCVRQISLDTCIHFCDAHVEKVYLGKPPNVALKATSTRWRHIVALSPTTWKATWTAPQTLKKSKWERPAALGVRKLHLGQCAHIHSMPCSSQRYLSHSQPQHQPTVVRCAHAAPTW